ncbi:MAG: hypothetical protein QGH15_15190 [Kiritimatiellia bacterium]|nr:hypothetical protein [Kiritimatiellia bacterium]
MKILRPMRLAGALLLLISLVGILHGIRAGIAQVIYCHSRYMSREADPETILKQCGTAHSFYPYNYYFCIWAGENAYHNRGKGNTARSKELLAAAGDWADTGHDLNPYNSELAVLKTDVLAGNAGTMEEAIALWESYLDWNFWEPFNHFVMIDLYIKAGRLQDAEEALYWLQDTKYFTDLAKRLESEFRKQLKMEKR